MAGRKQHYIPQSVQRAFEASRARTKSQVLVFRKGREPYATSIEGSAAERDFYSNPLVDGKGALDDQITDFESEHLGAMLRELRGTQRGRVDSELAAITVAHLALRTAHVRGSMRMLADTAADQIRKIIEDRDAIRRFAGVDAATVDSRFVEMVREALSPLMLDAWPQKDRNAIERMVVFRIRERFDDLFVLSKDSARTALESLSTNAAGSIAMGHARVLSKSLIPQEHVNALRVLDWEIVRVDEAQHHLILPDCVAIASSGATGYQPLHMLAIKEAVAVVMPLSPRQLLVGGASPARIDPVGVNADFARCSLEFFISSKWDEDTVALAELIGSSFAELEMKLLEADDVAPVFTASSACREIKVPIRVPIGKTGEAMKKALSRLAGETIEPVSTERVESIAVVANMASALEAVWKRAPTAAELEAAILGSVEAVKSGGGWKCRVIVPRSLAQALLQPTDSRAKTVATRAIKLHLGRVYYFDCWVRRYPEMVDLRPGLALWDQAASRVAFRAGSYYFGGLTSAGRESELFLGGERLKELAATFRLCFTALRQARQQSFVHRSVDQLVADTIGPIDALLTSFATTCGFLEAKDIGLSRDSDLGDVLSAAGLWEWGLLFAKDLGRHYATRERWSSSSDLDPLVGHVERLLWTIGVIVSKTDSGHWIDIVDDTRMVILEKILLA